MSQMKQAMDCCASQLHLNKTLNDVSNNSNAYGIGLAFGSRPILGLQTPDLVADAQLAFSQPGPLWSWVCIGCSGMASKKSAKFEN